MSEDYILLNWYGSTHQSMPLNAGHRGPSSVSEQFNWGCGGYIRLGLASGNFQLAKKIRVGQTRQRLHGHAGNKGKRFVETRSTRFRPTAGLLAYCHVTSSLSKSLQTRTSSMNPEQHRKVQNGRVCGIFIQHRLLKYGLNEVQTARLGTRGKLGAGRAN